MATLRLVTIECETPDAEFAAQLIRLALSGPATAVVRNGIPKAAAPVQAAPAIEPAKPVVADLEASRKLAKRRKGNFTIAPKEQGIAESTGSTQKALLVLLAKGPLTTAECIAQTKLSPPSVYSALTVLRQSGEVDTRADEDMIRKNFLKS